MKSPVAKSDSGDEYLVILRVSEARGHYLQEGTGSVFLEQLLEGSGDRYKTLSANSAVPKDTARFFAIF